MSEEQGVPIFAAEWTEEKNVRLHKLIKARDAVDYECFQKLSELLHYLRNLSYAEFDTQGTKNKEEEIQEILNRRNNLSEDIINIVSGR